jgi:hypothetical protein
LTRRLPRFDELPATQLVIEGTEERVIVFHKLRLDLKMGWYSLDAMAKRLTKDFGWTEETFLLREKVDDR